MVTAEGMPVGSNKGSATGGAPRDAGILHVEEQGRRAAAGGHLPLALLGVLARLLAVLAANRDRQRSHPFLGDLFAALEAIAIVAVLETTQRIVNLVERFRL